MTRLACILLNYRNPEDTSACLESLARSRFDGKIFLVNNFPEDGSGIMLRAALEGSGIPFLYLEPGVNTGFAGGCNLGIREALRENFSHILILNNDTVVAPDFFDEASRLAALHPDEVLAGKILEIGTEAATHNIGSLSSLTGRVRHIFDPEYKGEIDFVSGCLMIVPCAVLKKTGLFDEKLFMYCEDMDLCMRFKREAVHIRYCPSILIHHKFSASAKASGLPKERYIQRNQTYVILRRGNILQKMSYSLLLLVLPFYKALIRPRLAGQAVRGAWEGVRGRLGPIAF